LERELHHVAEGLCGQLCEQQHASIRRGGRGVGNFGSGEQLLGYAGAVCRLPEQIPVAGAIRAED
jgi:hypothetical protein